MLHSPNNQGQSKIKIEKNGFVFRFVHNTMVSQTFCIIVSCLKIIKICQIKKENKNVPQNSYNKR